MAAAVMKARNSPKAGIWAAILEQAARPSQYQNSHVLLLGRRDVGKSALIWALQKVGFGIQKASEIEYYKDNDGVSAVDYAYMNVRNVEDAYSSSECLAKMNLWVLQDEVHKDVLLSQFKPEYLKDSALIITLDLSEPWSLKEQLTAWLDFASELLGSMLKTINVDEVESMRQKVAHYIQTYRSFVTNETAGDFAKRHVDMPDDDDDAAKLKVNFGVPIIVCVCKSDYAPNLDTRNSQGHIDVIEAHLRLLCLPYGASLIFCSGKNDAHGRNQTLLYRYLMHRIYGFEFKEPAITTPKDQLFYPAGWDSDDALMQFSKSTIAGGFEQPFSAIISESQESFQNKQKPNVDTVTGVEDYNTFLSNQLKENPSLAAADAVAPPPVSAKEKGSPTSAKERHTARGPLLSTRTDAADTTRGRRSEHLAAARGDPASLRSFFHTLLAKGPKQATSPHGKGGGEAVEKSMSTSRLINVPKGDTLSPEPAEA